MGQELLGELVLAVARALVDDPEQVKVDVIEATNSLVIELSVSKKDIGKIIGKQGRTANALRTILTAAGAKVRNRVVLEVIE
jgi:predicted RNA-binding protein YlqC (UPF0109 family)